MTSTSDAKMAMSTTDSRIPGLPAIVLSCPAYRPLAGWGVRDITWGEGRHREDEDANRDSWFGVDGRETRNDSGPRRARSRIQLCAQRGKTQPARPRRRRKG